MSNRISQKTFEEFKNGSGAGYEYIFKANYDRIKFFIYKMIKNDAEAEELAQDVFLKLWENRCKIESVERVVPYMNTLAKNLTFNHISKKNHENNYVNNEKYVLDFSTDLESAYDAKELNLYIKTLVAQMPEQRKKVFMLSREQGLSNIEIAQKMNLSTQTVSMHLQLALDFLRKALFMLISLIFLLEN